MRALHHFIIELPEVLSDTFKTENGVEIYADKRFSVDRLSNRQAKVIATPMLKDSEIQPGYEVMIEPTFMYKQIYKGQTQDYTNYVDRKKNWFRVDANMVILYRKDESDQWKGYGQNVLVKPIVKEEAKIVSEFVIIPEEKEKFETDRVTMLYPNKEVKERGVNAGDEVLIDPRGGVLFWIEGVEHWWLRTRDIWGLITKKAV